MAGIVTTGGRRGPQRAPRAVYGLALLALAAVLAAMIAGRAGTRGSAAPDGAAARLDAPSKAAGGEGSATSGVRPNGGLEPSGGAERASSEGGGSNVPVAGNAAGASGGAPHRVAAPTAKQVAPQPVEAPAQKKVFDNDVEAGLMDISRVDFDCLEPPRVDLSHEETLEILRRPIQIDEGDDEQTVAAKERTAAMKEAALKYVEEGGTLNQFFRDYAAQAREAAATLRDVREEMLRIFHDQGQEAAQAYLDEVNPPLREIGLKEIRIGKGMVKMMERRWAREAGQGE